jgi:ferredoxin
MSEAAKVSIVVQPHGWRFEADAGRPLLASALAAGVILPSSCRNGTCRACMCLMQEGRVHYQIEWPGLSIDEKREGYILPCVACPDTDLTLVSRHARLKEE